MAGVNIEKARQKKEQREKEEERRKNFSPTLWWKPSTGENRVRLMPPWTDEGDNGGQFWREVHIHWGVGMDEDDQRNFNCPARTPYEGGACPICDYVKQLRATKNPADKEMAKEIVAKPSYYSNIVDLDDPAYIDQDVADWIEAQDDKERECPFKAGDSKVQIWRYGVTLFDDILDYFTGGKDVTDLKAGRDLIITRKGKGKEDTKYRLRAETDDSDFVYRGKRALEATISNLDERFTMADPDEMHAQLTGEEAPAQSKSTAGKKKEAPALPPPADEQPGGKEPGWMDHQKQEAKADGSDEEPPECFKDADIYKDDDPECVGGEKGNEVFDVCPFKDDCRLAVVGPEKPARRRRPGKKASSTTLEDEMREHIK